MVGCHSVPPSPSFAASASSAARALVIPASYRQNMAAAESRDVTTLAVAVATRVTTTKRRRRYLGAPRVAYINSRGARGAENTSRRELGR